MQNFKEDKPQPVRDEYEYVSDDGELKIDEFPIRRKKNAPKRDLSCKLGGHVKGQTQPCRACLERVGVRRGWPERSSQSHHQLPSTLVSVLLDRKEPLPTPGMKPKLDSALYKVSSFRDPEAVAGALSAWGATECLHLPHSSWSLWVECWLGSSGGDVSPRPCTERESRCGMSRVCRSRRDGPQERPARYHEDVAAP